MNRNADVELRAYAKSNYIRSAKATLQLLEYNAGVLEKFLYGYHKMGIKYFDPRSRDGYISIIGSRDHPDLKRNYTNAELEEEAAKRIVLEDGEDYTDWFDSIQLVNKKQFMKEKSEFYGEGGSDENGESDESDEDEDEIAIDDVHRHDVIFDVVTHEISAVDERDKDGKHTDFIFTWDRLDEFVLDHPDGDKIIIHGEGDTTFFYLPIPTLTGEEETALRKGSSKRRSSRMTRKSKTTRKAKTIKRYRRHQ